MSGTKTTYNDDIFDRLKYQNADRFLEEYLARNETTYYDYRQLIQYTEVNNDASQADM